MAKDPQLDKYLRILERLRAGREVSKEELKHFASYSQDIDEGKLEKIRLKLSTKEGLANLTDEDVTSYIDEGRKALSSPAYKDKTLELARDAEQGKLSDKIAAGLNTALSGIDIASSIKQINQANKLAKTPRPGRPNIPNVDPRLDQALNKAQQGTFDQSRALAPAQLQILNQYLSDINNAKVVSGGQSGTYGALGQVAANRRNEAAQSLIPLADQIKAREQGRYDNLLGMKLQQNQQNFDNQNQLYNVDLDQYNQAQRAAGALGATGRSNLRNSMANFGQQIPGAIASGVVDDKYKNIYKQMEGYGADNAAISAYANKAIDDRYSNPYGTLTSDDTINQAYGY